MSDVIESPTLSPTTGLSGRKSKIPLLLASPDQDRELSGRESRSPSEKYDDSRSVVSLVSLGRDTGSNILKKSKLPIPKLTSKTKVQKITKDYVKSSRIPRALKRSPAKIKSKTNEKSIAKYSAKSRETATDDSRSADSPVSQGRATVSDTLKKSKLLVPRLSPKTNDQNIRKDNAKGRAIANVELRSDVSSVSQARETGADSSRSVESPVSQASNTGADSSRSVDSPVGQASEIGADSSRSVDSPVGQASEIGADSSRSVDSPFSQASETGADSSRSVDSPVSQASETGADSSRSVDSPVLQVSKTGVASSRSVESSVSQASETGADSSRSVDSPARQASETDADSSRSVESPVSQASEIGADSSRSVDCHVSQASETDADSSRSVESPVSQASNTDADSSRSVDSPARQASETDADSSRSVDSPVGQASESGADSSRSVDSPVNQASEICADSSRSVDSPVSQASETDADSSRSVESPVSQASETGADSSRSVDSPVSQASETGADSSRSVDSPVLQVSKTGVASSRSVESSVSQASETDADSSRSVESSVSQASETGADSSRSVDSPARQASETDADSSQSVDSPVSQACEIGADSSRSVDCPVSQASETDADSSRSVESPVSQASNTDADSSRSVDSPAPQASETDADSSRSVESPVSQASNTDADSSRSVDSPATQASETDADSSRSVDSPVSQACEIGADSSRSVDSPVSQARETDADSSRSVESPVSQASETSADSLRSRDSPVSQVSESGANSSRSVVFPVRQGRKSGTDSSRSVVSPVSQAKETGTDSLRPAVSPVSQIRETDADSSRSVVSPVSRRRETIGDALKRSKLPVPGLSPKTNAKKIIKDDVICPRMPRTLKRSPAKIRSNSKRGKLQVQSSSYDLRAIRSVYGKPLPKITKSTDSSVGNKAICGDQLPVTDKRSRIPNPVAKDKGVQKKMVGDKKSHRALNELDVGKTTKRTVKTKRKRKQSKDISSRPAWDDQTHMDHDRTSRLPKLITRKQCPTWHGDMALTVPNNMTKPVLPAIGKQNGGNIAAELARTRDIRGKGEINGARCAGQHAPQKKGRSKRNVQDNFTRMRADMAVWKEIAVKKMADNLRPKTEAKPRSNMSIYRHGPIPRGNPYISSSSTRQPLKAIHSGGGDRGVPYRPTQEERKCGDVSRVMISVENVAAFVQSSIVYLKGIGDAMDKKWRTANEIVETFEETYKDMRTLMGAGSTSSLSSVSSHEAPRVYTSRSEVSSHEAPRFYTPRSDVSSHEAPSVYTDANLNATSGVGRGSNDRNRANRMIGDANETANAEIEAQVENVQVPKKTKRRRLLVRQTKKSSQMIQFNKQPKLTPITPYSPGDENYKHSNTCLDVPGCDTPSSWFSSRPMSRVSSIDMDVGSSGAEDSGGDEIHSSCCGRATHSAPGQLQRGKQQKRRIKFRSKYETRKCVVNGGTDTPVIVQRSVDHRNNGIKDLAQPVARSDTILPDIYKRGNRNQHSESANAGDERGDGVKRKKAGTRKPTPSSTPTLRSKSATIRDLDIDEENLNAVLTASRKPTPLSTPTLRSKSGSMRDLDKEEEKSYVVTTSPRAANRPLSSHTKRSGSCTLPDLK